MREGTGHNVRFCDILSTRNGRSRGCGIVTFETKEAARDAIEKIHDTTLHDRLLFVRADREPVNRGGNNDSVPKRPRATQRGGNSNTRSGDDVVIQIANLPSNATWQRIKDKCRAHPELNDLLFSSGNNMRGVRIEVDQGGLGRFISDDKSLMKEFRKILSTSPLQMEDRQVMIVS